MVRRPTTGGLTDVGKLSDEPDMRERYISVVFSHWRALLWTWLSVAGVVVGLTATNLLDWPGWALALVLTAGLVVAQWRAWDEMRLKRNQALERLAASAGSSPLVPWLRGREEELRQMKVVCDAITEPQGVGYDEMERLHDHFREICEQVLLRLRLRAPQWVDYWNTNPEWYRAWITNIGEKRRQEHSGLYEFSADQLERIIAELAAVGSPDLQTI
jgi:hypothetical protein